MEGVGEGGEEYLLCKLLSSREGEQLMLCFGGGGEAEEVMVEHKCSDQSSLSTMGSSPSSISATNSPCSGFEASRVTEKSGVARGGRGGNPVGRTSKKTKTEAFARQGTIKVRKEKLGDRISALQQLVSPYGKTDTASVLHEALGYIRFLHDQVQVLSSPYLERQASPAPLHEGEGGPRWSDLRSRGLCLVPVSCTDHIASRTSNGADLWAPSNIGSSDHYSPSGSQN